MDLPSANRHEANALDIIRAFSFKDFMTDGYDYYKANPTKLKDEVLSGITVAIMQVPESVAFSFVAGVHPLSGLYATFFLGFITAFIGGRPAQISGAAGAMAVVIKDLMLDDGPLGRFTTEERFEHLLMTVLLCGAFQTVCGFIQLATLVKLIPQPAMVGFMNGLAIVIFMAQFGSFKECTEYEIFTDCSQSQLQYMSASSVQLWLTVLLSALTMLVMTFAQRLLEGVRFLKVILYVPVSLTAIIIGTTWEWLVHRALLGIATRTVGDTAAINGQLPSFHFPSVGAGPTGEADWGVIMQYAVMLCFIGLIESVMTLQAVDKIVEALPSTFRANQECVAQGIGNFVCGLFGAMGGDAMIGQSTVNVINGARGRVSGFLAGWMILFFVIALSPAIVIIPIGTLTGVLFMIVIHTFCWRTFALLYMRKLPYSDLFIILEVTFLSVLVNLAVGVLAGVVTLSVLHAWRTGAQFESYQYSVTKGKVVRKVYELKTPLFFSSIRPFIDLFQPATDPDIVIVDFTNSAILDYSAVNAIDEVLQRYCHQDKVLLLQNLSVRDKELLAAANRKTTSLVAGRQLETALCDIEVLEEPWDRHVATPQQVLRTIHHKSTTPSRRLSTSRSSSFINLN